MIVSYRHMISTKNQKPGATRKLRENVCWISHRVCTIVTVKCIVKDLNAGGDSHAQTWKNFCGHADAVASNFVILNGDIGAKFNVNPHGTVADIVIFNDCIL